MGRRFTINPFYPLLVAAGVAFGLTAFAYGIMALRAMSPAGVDNNHPLLVFLDHHGMLLMGVELACLATASLLAMATDSYWEGTPKTPQEPPPQSGSPESDALT